jgi:hypothetical protein
MSKGRRPGAVVPGNSVEEARVWAAYVHSVGIAVLKMERLFGEQGDGKMELKEIRVTKRELSKGGGYLVVVKGRQEGRRVVGFCSGYDAAEVLRTTIEGMNNGTFRVREDRPYAPPQTQ